MALKSHKVRQHDDDEEEEQPHRRHRKMTLEQLERRVQHRRVANGAKGIVGVLQTVNKGLAQLNKGMSKMGKKMPSDRNLSKDIWS